MNLFLKIIILFIASTSVTYAIKKNNTSFKDLDLKINQSSQEVVSLIWEYARIHQSKKDVTTEYNVDDLDQLNQDLVNAISKVSEGTLQDILVSFTHKELPVGSHIWTEILRHSVRGKSGKNEISNLYSFMDWNIAQDVKITGADYVNIIKSLILESPRNGLEFVIDYPPYDLDQPMREVLLEDLLFVKNRFYSPDMNDDEVGQLRDYYYSVLENLDESQYDFKGSFGAYLLKRAMIRNNVVLIEILKELGAQFKEEPKCINNHELNGDNIKKFEDTSNEMTQLFYSYSLECKSKLGEDSKYLLNSSMFRGTEPYQAQLVFVKKCIKNLMSKQRFDKNPVPETTQYLLDMMVEKGLQTTGDLYLKEDYFMTFCSESILNSEILVTKETKNAVLDIKPPDAHKNIKTPENKQAYLNNDFGCNANDVLSRIDRAVDLIHDGKIALAYGSYNHCYYGVKKQSNNVSVKYNIGEEVFRLKVEKKSKGDQ